MKKLYFLSLCCIFNIVAYAQTTTTTIYATGTTGSYKTGNATATARTSGNIRCTGTTRRGWGVFDLTTIPAGTSVSSCVIGFNVATYGGTGTPSAWDTYGYVGDLSTVTTAATLLADCASGTSISTATYGTATGNKTLATTAASQAFISANAGNLVSICWTGGNTRSYTITGLAGTAATTGTHRPYMTIQYCTGVTNVSAAATPDPVCSGSTLTLTGSATGAATYTWAGPGGFTSTSQSPALTASATSAGVYTFTAYNTGGCATTAITASVTLASSPGAISGATSMCTGGSVTLSETTTGGTWSSAPASVATINTGGTLTGIGSGASVVSYSYGCGSATYTVTVNPLPAAISGPATVCQGTTISLTDASTPGTWSSSSPSTASINSSGIVNGLAVGNTTITFTNNATTCSTTVNISVLPTPAPIGGLLQECIGQSITLTESVSGGTWSSANSSIASVSSLGVVTGLTGGGSTTIKYTNSCATVSIVNTVNPLPDSITGKDSVCALTSSLLSSGSNGGTWTSNSDLIATLSAVSDNSAAAYGVSAGSTIITYTLPTGCYITGPFTVAVIPPAIQGPSIGCPGETITLSDPELGGAWSTSDTFVAVIQDATLPSSIADSGLMTGVSPDDTVTIYYTMPEGCYSSKLIFVSTLPAPISGITATCAGLPDTLKDDSVGGTWSVANTAIATITWNGILTTLSAGTTEITYTMPATGCYITTSELVHPLPVPSIIFNGDDNTFTVSDTNYVSYQWYIGPSPSDTAQIPGAVSYNVAALYNEYYTVVVVDSFGCRSAAVPYDMTNLGVSNLNGSNTFNISPNPATSALSINASVAVNAIINDMSGKVVLEQKDATQINISKLTNGIYIISLYDMNGRRVTVQKFIKE